MVCRSISSASLADVRSVARLLEDFPAPWFVCGGWAIDLFAGVESRAHADLEIGIRRSDQGLLPRLLSGWKMYRFEPRDNEDAEILPWSGENVLSVPVHQVMVQNSDAAPPEFEFFLQEVSRDVWSFRRMQRIQMPFGEVYLSSVSGIPVVAPEVQLLYKSTYHREKDEQDFELVLPMLSEARRAWLRSGLMSYHPADAWIDRLS